MRVADHWLDTLALAGVPALLCLRAGDGIVMLSRTPPAVALLRDGRLDVDALRRSLASAWPTDSAPVVVRGNGTPAWQCVLRRVDDTRCLAILRVPSARQLRNEAFFNSVEKVPDVVARFDRRYRHLYINPVITEITGLTPQQYIGKDNRELGMPEHLVELWNAVHRRVFETGEPFETEFEFPSVDGPRHFLFRVVPEFDARGRVQTVLSTARDVSELKRLQERLATLARTDPLTSLLNRRSFIDRADAELARVRDGRGELGLILLDVNDFKSVNDRFGHTMGDSVLTAIARALQDEIGPDDFAARLGGDEFCVGVVDADATHVRAVVERIRGRVNDIGRQSGCPAELTVSIGVTAADPDDRGVSDLVARVDRLMYREKFGRAGTPGAGAGLRGCVG